MIPWNDSQTSEPRHVIFGQSAFKRIDGIQRRDKPHSFCWTLTSGVICAKLVTAGNPTATRRRVVVGDTIIPIALHITHHQIFPAKTAIAEEQVADIADRHQIRRLPIAIGFTFQDDVNVGGGLTRERLERAGEVSRLGSKKSWASEMLSPPGSAISEPSFD